jgi:hypothetical protein
LGVSEEACAAMVWGTPGHVNWDAGLRWGTHRNRHNGVHPWSVNEEGLAAAIVVVLLGECPQAYKYEEIPEAEVFKSLSNPSVNLKVIPDVDYKPKLAQLVTYNLKPMKVLCYGFPVLAVRWVV